MAETVKAHYEMGEHLRQDKIINDARIQNWVDLVARADALEADLVPLLAAEDAAHKTAAEHSRVARLAESEAKKARAEAKTAIRLRSERTGA